MGTQPSTVKQRIEKVLKWVVLSGFFLGTSLVMLSATGADVPRDRSPTAYTFVYESKIPVILQADAVTLCQTVHFRHTKEQVNPFRNAGMMQLWRHEFEHVHDCERLGWVTFYRAYHLISQIRFFYKYWNMTKAYLSNNFEQAARRASTMAWWPGHFEAVRLEYSR